MTELANNPMQTSEAFRELEFGAWRVVIAQSFSQAFQKLAATIELDRQSDLSVLGIPAVDATGRGRNRVIDLPGESRRLHLRPLHHGGILARVTEDRFASLDRPLTELEVTTSLSRRGAPVTEPAFVIAQRIGLFWRAAFATVHLEGAVDGVAFLNSEPGTERLERATRAAGSAIRSLHDLGCNHADLHIKNLMIEEVQSATRATIVDFDRSNLVAAVDARRRMIELMRLRRSLRKRGFAKALSPTVASAFMEAYADGDGHLRDQLLAHHRTQRLRNRAHAWLYPEL